MKKIQFGRSMIEMLGVLAIIGVLSIGGIALYRRAVNNHHANTILDDVNRFAFAIIEKGSYPLDADIPKGDFKESGIYTLKGHQAAGANRFSILVQNVPKGVCEPLVDKGIIDYKVGVVTAGGSVDNEIVYDTLHKDICNNDVNDVAFYFGDTSGVCNIPEGNTPAPCTVNSDCCRGEFCWYPYNSDSSPPEKGECTLVSEYTVTAVYDVPGTMTMSDGKTWTRSKDPMNRWSAQNWCEAQGLKTATRADLGCGHVADLSYCTKSATEAPTGGTEPGPAYAGSALAAIQEYWGGKDYHWLEYENTWGAYYVGLYNSHMILGLRRNLMRALCH